MKKKAKRSGKRPKGHRTATPQERSTSFLIQAVIDEAARRGLTMADVAEMEGVGLSKRHLWAVARGEKDVTTKKLEGVMRALGLGVFRHDTLGRPIGKKRSRTASRGRAPVQSAKRRPPAQRALPSRRSGDV